MKSLFLLYGFVCLVGALIVDACNVDLANRAMLYTTCALLFCALAFFLIWNNARSEERRAAPKLFTRTAHQEDGSDLKRQRDEHYKRLCVQPLNLAALPDLYEACRTALGAYNILETLGANKHLPGYDYCLRDLKAAIEKAETISATSEGIDTLGRPLTRPDASRVETPSID